MRRALGKGLAQLVGEQSDAATSELDVDAIVPNRRQPRLHFDSEALNELAASIKEVGVLQPLIVRPIREGMYELIAGERRLRAAKLAGLSVVPVMIRSAGDQSALELALIENLQREDIGPLECAKAYRVLSEKFELTQEQIAGKVGKSRAAVANALRLLRLPEAVRVGLESGQITEGHARAILMAQGASTQLRLFRAAVERGLSVREVERLARIAPKPELVGVPRAPKTIDRDLERVEEALAAHFGAPVRLRPGQRSGTIEIQYYGDQDLQRILDVLGVSL